MRSNSSHAAHNVALSIHSDRMHPIRRTSPYGPCYIPPQPHVRAPCRAPTAYSHTFTTHAAYPTPPQPCRQGRRTARASARELAACRGSSGKPRSSGAAPRGSCSAAATGAPTQQAVHTWQVHTPRTAVHTSSCSRGGVCVAAADSGDGSGRGCVTCTGLTARSLPVLA